MPALTQVFTVTGRNLVIMKSRQRVLAALNREQPDKIPIVESIDVPIQVKLGQILGLDIAEST